MPAMVYPGGGVAALHMDELPDPEPAPGQILVRVRACAMNRLDVGATSSQAPC
jgi:NADPH:quinone reductase-like Zn-dependent oxidoreductase